jgi:hypothetical protein
MQAPPQKWVAGVFRAVIAYWKNSEAGQAEAPGGLKDAM